MGWTKVVLIFQAIVTLIIGIAFFTQVAYLDKAKIEKLQIEISSASLTPEETETIFIDLKQRYQSASYILGIVAIIEILLIGRFVDS